MPTMTSPFLRTTRCLARPALSEKTVAQNPGGSLIDSSQPPVADVVAFRHAASAMSVRTSRRDIAKAAWMQEACWHPTAAGPSRAGHHARLERDTGHEVELEHGLLEEAAVLCGVYE